LFDRLSCRPNQGVAFTAQDNDVRTGAVAMGFFVRADGKFLDMAGSGIFLQLELDVVPPRPALTVIH
jgi:hypothetical protein